MQFIVGATQATPLRRRQGSNVTLVNQGAVDVYCDENPNRLNSTVTGAVPSGTEIAAGGGQLQYSSYPGVLWFRAAQVTTIEVQ